MSLKTLLTATAAATALLAAGNAAAEVKCRTCITP